MEEKRSDRIKRFGLIFSQARVASGKSQEYMSMELGVSKKTVQNWEKGVSCPTFFQTIEWFRILEINPFPQILSFVYPDIINTYNKDPDDKIEETFDHLVTMLPLSAKKAILFIFYGKHGSSPNAILQLILAHLHTPLSSRITQAVLTTHLYSMEKDQHNLICPDDIQPDMNILTDAVNSARVSNLHYDYGHNCMRKEDAD